MKKIILLITFLFSLSMADSVLLVKKGWQLIGSSVPLYDMHKFTEENVEQVWHFDAQTQKWLAYSPDTDIRSRMSNKNIGKLTKLKNWHGFWIKSKKDWTIVFEEKKLTTEPTTNNNNDIIELKKGWNLISLPVNSVLSANIFEGMIAWKYNDNHWELSDPTQEASPFPELGHIKNSDGIWVKAPNDKNISVSQEASKLHTFKNNASIEAYVKEMATLYQRPTCGIEPLISVNNTRNDMLYAEPASADSSAIASNTSGTNLQENGVDEADILKHNSKYVFYIGRDTDYFRNHINISSFEKLAHNEQTVLKTITVNKKEKIDSFYLVKNKLVVLSTLDADDLLIDSHEEIDKNSIYGFRQTMVNIFDVSNIDNIQKTASYKIHGSLKNSRVINDKLYLISSFNSKYETEYPKEYFTPTSTCQEYLKGAVASEETRPLDYVECYNIEEDSKGFFRYNYDKPNVTVTQLLPKIEGTNLVQQNLVTAKLLYASSKKKQRTTMSSISQFSLTTGAYLNTTSFMGNSSVEYGSSKSLYLVSNEYPYYYDFNNYKSRSTIYKFNFDEDLSYKAVGSVYGTALNQFSLSEYQNILRIATTEGFSWGSTGTKNSLYTLKENNKLLSVEGVLTGLGKEGETIKSVRFIGSKAYLVTFKTTDPLYSIDLSNPKVPKKMGELHVNGYSAYLHPIGNDKLLGIGQDADENGRGKGVKIELFDISDFENPSSLDSITLSEGTYSEVENNHKALAYRSSDQLFAFPFANYGTQFNNYQQSNHLGIYQVDGDSLKSYEIVQADIKDWGRHRGLIFDLNNTTYVSFFSDDNVITSKLTTKEN